MEATWALIKHSINEAIQESVPLTKVTGHRGKRWMDKETLALVRKKHKLFRRWQETQDGQDYLLHSIARNQASKACKKAKKQLEKKVAQDVKKNPKAFWSFVKSKTQTRKGVVDLKMPNGEKTRNDQEKADLLNQFSHNAFTQENDESLPDPPIYNVRDELSSLVISTEKVEKLLRDLNKGKVPGPDGINPRVLSEAAKELAPPLQILFQRSIDSSTVPEEWKKAVVTPIYKKGSRLQTCNYRPVSLTSIVCKTLENFVRESIMDHFQANDLLSKHQHGFVPGRSCFTQLVEIMDNWTEVICRGRSVDAIYMDFQKQFDTVPHRRLLLKAEAMGIRGNILKWIQSFLQHRQQCVVINGTYSRQAPVTSGIPQGSVLGPVLFILYINDLPVGITSSVKMFAVDTKLYNNSSKEQGTQTLQDDLEKLQDWSDLWLLKFHPDKCCILKLGVGHPKSEADYHMKGKTNHGEECTVRLEENEREKDLGIIVDRDLTFKGHITQAANIAQSIVGII